MTILNEKTRDGNNVLGELPPVDNAPFDPVAGAGAVVEWGIEPAEPEGSDA